MISRLWISLRCALAAMLLAATASLAGADDPADAASERRPNVVIIFTDDQGYGDLGCFGAKGFKTPRIDRMAAEGRKFTSFYVAQSVCTASRAGLVTGSYPTRIGMLGALGPTSRQGLPEGEPTLGKVFKSQGYKTACFGKWHLGHQPKFLPQQWGFDEYYGLPYSNDMWPFHPERPDAYPPLPLVEGDEVIELNPDQTKLTTEYTRRAVDFIERHRDEPFFVYLAHSMPHVPLFVSHMHKGTSEQGLYGDVMHELDWSVGQVLDTLQRLELDDNTLVVFTSDNGPWLSYGNHAGSAGSLREGKGTSFEGGVRVPCVMRWPGTIPAGTETDEMCMTVDLLPTLAGVIGAELPEGHILDGKDILPLMRGEPGATTPHEALFFYWGAGLEAVRSGPWKLHLPHTYRTLGDRPPGRDGTPAKYQQGRIGQELFNLENDRGETTNVAEQHPEVVSKLLKLVEQARQDLGDSNTRRRGANLRPASRL